MDAHFAFIIKTRIVVAFIGRKKSVIVVRHVEDFWASWTNWALGFDFTPVLS